MRHVQTVPYLLVPLLHIQCSFRVATRTLLIDNNHLSLKLGELHSLAHTYTLEMLTKNSFVDSAKRRRMSHWALTNAWKLAGLTAVVTFVGIFVAVSLSLVLRPIPNYYLPLMSDVSKYQLEGSILRLTIVIATALFFATTTASLFHCHALHLFSPDYSTLPVLHSHCDSGVDFQIDEIDLSEISVSTPTTVARKRHSRFISRPTFVLLLLFFTMLISTLQFPGVYRSLATTAQQVNFQKLLLKLVFYALVAICVLAMCFLVWYFLKLQNIPDPPLEYETLESVSAAFDDRINSLSSDDSMRSLPSPQPQRPKFSERIRAFVNWCIVLLRPVCLTGQAVCLIKIAGLWLALDTFSISNIQLVKLALLAALAFAEYTAAFFFAFFMTILAVDMRSKSPSPELIFHS